MTDTNTIRLLAKHGGELTVRTMLDDALAEIDRLRAEVEALRKMAEDNYDEAAAEAAKLRAEVEALRKTPSMEELAQQVADELTASVDTTSTKFLVSAIAKEAARAVLRALGRDA